MAAKVGCHCCFFEERECFNCSHYGWKQPEDKSTILQCVRCKVVYYCSRQCQEEHWHKLHKHHCKYLAKAKVMPLARHEETSCLVCRKEAETGRKKMSKPSNPVLPCTGYVPEQDNWSPPHTHPLESAG